MGDDVLAGLRGLERDADGASFGGLRLDPFQLEAIDGIEAGKDVIVAAPTGAGKTVIAEYAIEAALARGRGAIYTSPIKALSNQKYRDFSARFPGKVGLVTGDVSLDPDAPLLIMTTEIFRNAIVEASARYANVRHVVFDEVHFIDDADRGTVWEESLILAPESIRFVCLSATIPNVDEIASWIGEVRQTAVEVVVEKERPVPLGYRFYSERHGHFAHDELKDKFDRSQKSRFSIQRARRGARAILDWLGKKRWLPALYFAFNRRECEAKAWHNRHRKLLSPAERDRLTTLIDELIERYGAAEHLVGTRLETCLRRGIAYHHAGMLPTNKEIVERLFTAGLIKLLFATETFAVGVNMPACAVVFDALEKFDGIDFRPLRVLEFQQMAGRAGRRGMDERGHVCINIDSLEHVGYKKLRQILSGRVEAIRSQLNLGYSTILNLHGRLGEEVIHQLADRSFGRYQDLRRTGAGGEGKGGDGKEQARARKAADRRDRRRHEQLDRKLALLDELGYLTRESPSLPEQPSPEELAGPLGAADASDGEPPRVLTARGRFAARIQGYELQVSELFFGGELETLDAHQLAGVFAAVIYEAKKRTWFSDRHAGMLRKVGKAVNRRIRRLRQQEGRFGIDELSKPPEMAIAPVVHAWSRGASLADVSDLTNLPAGDLVRTLRLTVQLLRQVRHAAAGHDALVERLGEAIDNLKRDEADAEAQLRVE